MGDIGQASNSLSGERYVCLCLSGVGSGETASIGAHFTELLGYVFARRLAQSRVLLEAVQRECPSVVSLGFGIAHRKFAYYQHEKRIPTGDEHCSNFHVLACNPILVDGRQELHSVGFLHHTSYWFGGPGEASRSEFCTSRFLSGPCGYKIVACTFLNGARTVSLPMSRGDWSSHSVG